MSSDVLSVDIFDLYIQVKSKPQKNRAYLKFFVPNLLCSSVLCLSVFIDLF